MTEKLCPLWEIALKNDIINTMFEPFGNVMSCCSVDSEVKIGVNVYVYVVYICCICCPFCHPVTKGQLLDVIQSFQS